MGFLHDFIPTGYGEEMVQTRFDVVDVLQRGSYNGKYVTKTIVESEESWLGLGFQSTFKEWFQVEEKSYEEGQFSGTSIAFWL